MKRVSEKEFVEMFGTENQKKKFKEEGRLLRSNKRNVISRAEKYCDVTIIPSTTNAPPEYKLTKIKNIPSTYQGRKITEGIGKYLCPLILDYLIDKKPTILSIDRLMNDAGVLTTNYYAITGNLKLASSLFDVEHIQLIEFFAQLKSRIAYYVKSIMEVLNNEGIIKSVYILSSDYSCDHWQCSVFKISSIDEEKCINYRKKLASPSCLKIKVANQFKEMMTNNLTDKKISSHLLTLYVNLYDICFVSRRLSNIYPNQLEELRQRYNMGERCDLNCDECRCIKANTHRSTKHHKHNRDGEIFTRESPEYAEWIHKVLERDNYTCQCCGSKINPQAHHIQNYSSYPELRVDINNGITLCESCHAPYIMGSFHNIFGVRNNSKEQLDLYISKYGKIHQAIQNVINEIMEQDNIK